MNGNLDIKGATIGIDEKGMEAYRDAIETSILRNVSQGIVNKFQQEIAPLIRQAWGGLQEGARERFIMQMNQDMLNLQMRIEGLEKQVNIAFSEAIKKFRDFDRNYVATERIK